MYDTEERIELVKKRMYEYHRRQERRTVCRLSVLCSLLFLSLVGAMGIMQNKPINVTGSRDYRIMYQIQKKRTKESGCRKSCIKKGKGEKYEEKIISRDAGTCTVFYKYAPSDHICGRIYFRKSGCSV